MRAYGVAIACFSLASVALGYEGVQADTLDWALVQAYQNNPSLNRQRASLRAIDENVPQALSAYRPMLSITATGGYRYDNATSVLPLNAERFRERFAQNFYSRTIRATGTYILFNGFQTANGTRQAESQVEGGREALRVVEQQVLLDGATVYMDLLRDKAILDLNRSNVQVLTAQLQETRYRFSVGEVTLTDIAQAQSRLASGRSQLLVAQSQYVTSRANYRRVIGVEPGTLAPGTPVDRLSPNVLAKAISQGQAQSPSVLAAAYGVDVAELAVKISEGSLYPNLTLQASVLQGAKSDFEVNGVTQLSAVGQLTIPIYQGGGEYSAIRQSKDIVGLRRLTLDGNRDQARATVVQTWGQLDAAKGRIESTTANVDAAEIALNGVREEARVGQRTTLDVLNAQQELLNARVALVSAQRDRVIASYTLLAAVGSLSTQHLGLNVQIYDPMVHYQQVRDAWVGMHNPDGR